MSAYAFLKKDEVADPDPAPPEQPASATAAAFLGKEEPKEPEPAVSSKAAAFLAKDDEPANEPSTSTAAAFLAKDDEYPQSLAAGFIAREATPQPQTGPEDTAQQESTAAAPPTGQTLCLKVSVHELRLEEAVRTDLLERGARRLWVEAAIEPSVLLPTPLRSERVSVPTTKPPVNSASASGPVVELPLALVDKDQSEIYIAEGSALARALTAAVTSDDPRNAACVRLTLYGTSPQADGPPMALCSSTVSLQALLRRGSDLRRAPLRLFGREEDGTHDISVGLLVTLNAVEALRALVPTPLPPLAPQQAVTASSAPQAQEAAATARPPAKIVAPPPQPPSTPTADAAAVLSGVPGPTTPAPALGALPDPKAYWLAASTSLQLPIRLDLAIETLELSSSLADDPSVAKVQLIIDLVELSDGAMMTDRMKKPPASQRTLINHRASLPIYDAAYASRCMHVQAAAAESYAEEVNLKRRGGFETYVAKGSAAAKGALLASGGAKAPSARDSPSVKPLSPARRGAPTVGAPHPPASVTLVVKLVGMGRGGIRDLAQGAVPLENILKANLTSARKLEVLLHVPVEGGLDAMASPRGHPEAPATPQTPAPSQIPAAVDRIPGRGPAAARIVLTGKLISRSAPRRKAPPPAQRADEPQICVHAHSLRLPLRSSPQPRSDAADEGVSPPAELLDVHSVWIAISIAGLSEPISSETVRMADLLKGGSLAHAKANAATGGGPPRAVDEDADAAGRRRGGRPGSDLNALLTWGESCPIDAVALLELFGDGAEAFEEMRTHLFRVGGGGAPYGSGGGGFGVDQARATPMSASPLAATPDARGPASTGPARAAMSGARDPRAVGLVVELMGAGRMGHVPVGAVRLSLSELLSSTGNRDLVGAPLRLRSPRGVVVAEVRLSVALSHAVHALHHGTPRLLAQGVGAQALSGTTGAAIAVGAGEGYLMMKTSTITKANLLPTSVWVEVDLRRPLGQLLRSVARPAGASRMEFDLRELLYVSDGSPQQKRLAATLHPQAPAHFSDVTFAVYCTASRRSTYPSLAPKKMKKPPPEAVADDPALAASDAPATTGGTASVTDPGVPRKDKDTGANVDKLGKENAAKASWRDEDDEDEESVGGARDGGRYLIGRASVNLRQMLMENFEPLTEPLDLLDEDGAPAGMLCVSLLAKDAIGRARRSSLKGPGALELWVGAESLLVAPTLRSALSNAALWVEVHLELGQGAASFTSRLSSDLESGANAPTLFVASKRVRMPRGAPAGGGLASQMVMALGGSIQLPMGSAARSGLQRALKRGGGVDAALAFYLFSSTADAAPPTERRPLASSHVLISNLLAQAANAALHSGAKGEGEVDSLPIPVQLKNSRGELLATLAADVEGIVALRALASDGGSAPTGSASPHTDPEVLKRLLAQRRSDALNNRSATATTNAPAV